MGEHVRSPEVEDTLTTLNHDSPDRIFVSLVNRDFEPPTVDGPDGEPVRVTRNNRRRHFTSSDRAFRRRVYETFNEELTGSKHAIAAAYAEKVKTQSNLASIRNFDSARERMFNTESYPPTGLRIDFPTEAHDTMLETIQSNLGPYQRYQRLYRNNLDIEQLRPWDTGVPLADGDRPEIPYDNVRDHLLAAVEPLERHTKTAWRRSWTRTESTCTKRRKNVRTSSPTARHRTILVRTFGELRRRHTVAVHFGPRTRPRDEHLVSP